MRDTAFKNTDQFLKGEEWVLGGETMGDAQRREIANQLKAMYRAEYIKRWQTLLATTKVAGFAGIADASKKMLMLGGNPSPLLQLLNTVAVNTAVDSGMGAIFQPVTVVSPADSTKLIGEKAQPYMQAVLAVGTALQNVASAPAGQNEGPAQDAKTQSSTARNAALNMTLAFAGDPQAVAVGTEVRRLLTDPLGRVDPMLGNVGVAGVNAGGSNFCSKDGRVLTKAPFNPNGAPASLAEVNEFFQRNTSALWNFYNAQLTKYLVPQGDGYAAASGAGVKVSPRFLAFFSKAAQVSRGLYPEGQTGPRLTFGFRPMLGNDVVSVALAVDGQTRNYTKVRASEQLFNWVGAEAQNVKLDVTIGGNTQTKAATGTWGLWKIFTDAKNWKLSGGRLSGEWTFRHEGKDVTLPFELNIPSAPSILEPAWLSGLQCVSSIAAP
jgi:type VI secretion system protein ImpL